MRQSMIKKRECLTEYGTTEKKPWVGANSKGQGKDSASAKEAEREAKEIEGKPGASGITEAKRTVCFKREKVIHSVKSC